MTDKLSKFQFKPDDFCIGCNVITPRSHSNHNVRCYSFYAVEKANAKIAPLLDRLNELEAMIENAPTVYGHVKKGVPNWWGPHENNIFSDTHKAKLVEIEEIK